MKTPKITFRYSSIYDRRFKEAFKGKGYPGDKEILKYTKEIEKEWRKHEKKILTSISNITGLSWNEKEILVYVVGRVIPFSDPLTIGSRPDLEGCADILTHELIHRNWFYGDPKKKIINYFNKKYKNESWTTIVHIPLLAIHWKIFLELFDEKRLKKDKKYLSQFPDYKKAYEIVDKEGYEEIVSKFKSLARS